jgi:hypothetical protein
MRPSVLWNTPSRLWLTNSDEVLWDECVPRKLSQHFGQHECQAVPYLGSNGKKNGELLTLAEQIAIEVFVIVDQGIEYEQALLTGDSGA